MLKFHVLSVQRDPSKRKVKPVEEHLMQIHFGMSDDDEDSDYEFKPGKESDEEEGAASEEEDNEGNHKSNADMDNDGDSVDDEGSKITWCARAFLHNIMLYCGRIGQAQ